MLVFSGVLPFTTEWFLELLKASKKGKKRSSHLVGSRNEG